MSPPETILQFDVRRPAFPSEMSYREQYLYRLDAAGPFTVDTLIWPSMFENDRDLWAWDLPHLSPAQMLADTPAQYREQIASGELTLLAITSLTESGSHPREAHTWHVSPSAIGPDWEFLGFDVADEGMLSGLCNCGLPDDPSKKAALREAWGWRLNERHLFPDAASALEFQRHANQYAPEHAPFHVYGLWSPNLVRPAAAL